MMIVNYIVYISTIFTFASAGSYQYVRFVRPTGRAAASRSNLSARSGASRNSRSFPYPLTLFGNSGDVLPHGDYLPLSNVVDISHLPNEISQFSYDLNDYQDPLLLTGSAAHAAVAIIYGKGELFFGDYPHVRALLKNQDKRRKNGLAGNKLGSIRLNSPFLRFDGKYFSPY